LQKTLAADVRRVIGSMRTASENRHTATPSREHRESRSRHPGGKNGTLFRQPRVSGERQGRAPNWDAVGPI